jgi:hypothetical protein
MILLLLAGTIGLQSGESAQQLNFLRVSYKANKDSFAFGTFRFEYTRGSCASPSDAESGVFSRSVTEHGLYVFDGKNARFDLIADPKDIAAATTPIGKDMSSSFAWSYRTLTDGKLTLIDTFALIKEDKTFVHRPQIYEGINYFYLDAFFQFPLWLGADGDRPYDLFHDLTEIQEGRGTLVELDLDSRLDGLRVCMLSYTYTGGKRTYWIDVNRGSVPLRIVNHYDEDNSDSIFTFSDLEHVAGAGWLPRRRLHVLDGGKVVDRIVVTEIDVHNKPPSSAFQLEFPDPVRLVNQPRGLVYKRGKTWSLLKLPDPSSPGTEKIEKFLPSSLDELPGEIEAGSPWPVIVPVVLVLFLGVGSVVVLRRRNRSLRGARGQ